MPDFFYAYMPGVFIWIGLCSLLFLLVLLRFRKEEPQSIIEEDMARFEPECRKEDYSPHSQLEFWRRAHCLEGQSPGYQLKVLDSHAGLSTYGCSLWHFGDTYNGIGTTPEEAVSLALEEMRRDSW